MRKKQFKAESQRLLDLMINSIYTHKEIFLREIISNASDAMDKLAYLSLTDDKVGISRDDLKITITADKENRTITVTDNGVGMSAGELEKNLGVIANSGSLRFKDELKEQGEGGEDLDIIGQFGVGFYSAFMVAEQVTVISRAYGEESAAKWQSSGAEGYTITECEKDEIGTQVIMKLRPDSEDEDYSEFLEEFRLKGLIKKYSDYIRYPIMLEDECVNSRIPLWQRDKSEVTDEECAAFYKEKYYDMEDPVKVIRVSAEGVVSYKAMLFIPANAPYNYYTRDFEPGLQLYSSGVMIMEKCADLLPEHFRFVRGVVDSQDLSLNISREILQHDRQLKVIAGNLEKKITAELKKLMESEPEKYEEFYKSFGLQLKYGIVSGFGANKDKLQDLLMFYSSKEEKEISLARYAETMPEEQQYIYYACGESVSRLDKLPQTEPIRDAGYGILYLTHEVDEFVTQMLGSYGEKTFKSVNSEDLGLNSEDKKQEVRQWEEENKELLEFVKESLGGAVSEVKLSHKLKSHPVCLGAGGGISLEMEKYFQSIPGGSEDIRAERVLEINPEHAAFDKLRFAYGEDRDKAAKFAELLYNQALLIADIPIEDPVRYTDLIFELMG